MIFKNRLKTALKHLKNHKTYALINIAGFAMGMAACILLGQYVYHETTYDSFHGNEENIYRIETDYYKNDKLHEHTTKIVPALGPALKEEYPEILEYARLFNFGDGVIVYEDTAVKTWDMFFADNSFLTMFSFPMVKGEAANALAEPYKAAISESTARKLFKNQDPIGKTIEFNCVSNWKYTVTGVFKDIPPNSHVQFDILLSLHQILEYPSFKGGWQGDNFYTYLLMTPNADTKSLQEKLPAFLDRYTGAEDRKTNSRNVYGFKPLPDIYLHSPETSWKIKQGNIQWVYFLAIAALVMLIFTWANHVHLVTAVRERHPGEKPGQLMKQYLLESLVLTIPGAIAAVIMARILNTAFNRLTTLPLPVSIAGNVYFWPTLAVIVLTGSLLTAIFSTAPVSSLKPETVGKSKPRKVLVIIQAAAAIVLLAGTITIYKQLKFVSTRDLGMETRRVLLVEAPLALGNLNETFPKIKTFFDELRENPAIISVTMSNIPGRPYMSSTQVGREGEPTFPVERCWCDSGLVDCLQLKLLAGRNLSKDNPADRTGTVILNETALHLLGLESPEQAINQVILDDNGTTRLTVIGVIKDYNQLSLKNPIDPVIFRYHHHYACSHYTFKLKTGNIKETVAMVKGKWDKYIPGNPFDYVFLDQYFDRQYDGHRQLGNVLAVLALLAMVFMAIGFIGLSAHTAASGAARQKANRQAILKDLSQVLLISIVIGTAAAYFIFSKWLENYAYRVEIGWWSWAIPALIIIPAALISISGNYIKAAPPAAPREPAQK